MEKNVFLFFSFLFLVVLMVTRIRWMETDGKGISKLDLPRELFFLLRKEILRRELTLSSSVPPKLTASETLHSWLWCLGNSQASGPSHAGSQSQA